MNVLVKITDVIISAGAVNGLFLAFVFTMNKNRKRRSNRILAVLLTVLSVSIIHSLSIAGGSTAPYSIKEPFILLVGPLLLFYFRECAGIQKFKRSDLLHFIPFALFFLVFFSMMVFNRTPGIGEFIHANSLLLTSAMWIGGVVQYGFYWGAVLRLFHTHTHTIESEFSNTDGKTLSWMKTFAHIFGLCFCLLVITVPIAVHSDNYALVVTVANYTLSMTIFILGYEGLFQEDVFSNAPDLPPLMSEQAVKPATSESQKASEEVNKFVPDLVKFMEEKKPYLNEGLTLADLARQVGMNRNQLSSVINAGIGDSFYTFINKYRVEEAKRLIANPKNANFTILTLAFEAGFPSKSSFHNVFKKITGITPAEYRNSLSRSQS